MDDYNKISNPGNNDEEGHQKNVGVKDSEIASNVNQSSSTQAAELLPEKHILKVSPNKGNFDHYIKQSKVPVTT